MQAQSLSAVDVNLRAQRDREYGDVVRAMQRLAQLDSYKNAQLFTVDTTGLYELYLNNLQSRSRQYFTCRTCEKFFDKYGGLVVANVVDGPKSILWPVGLPGDFGGAARVLSAAVSARPIRGAFYPTERVLGTPQLPVGVWDHLYVDLGASRKLHSEQFANVKTAAARENYVLLAGSNEKYNYKDVYAAVNGLVAGGYTSGVHAATLANLKWFLDVKTQVERAMRYGHNVDCVLWLYAASAPEGYCNLNSTVAGAYLRDMSENPGTALWRYVQRVSPTAYKRPTAAPSAGQVKEATAAFLEADLKDSLLRRSALRNEVTAFWQPWRGGITSSVFGEISVKGKTSAVFGEKTMTWNRFRSTILPQATGIKYIVPELATYAAITTAVIRSSKSIFLWGNTFAWYTYSDPSPSRAWGLEPKSAVNVLGVVDPPYLWSSATKGNTAEKHWPGKVFLILEGASDTLPHGPAIFPALLPPDLYKYRATIEQHCKEKKMSLSLSGQQASGLMLEDGESMLSARFIVTIGSESLVVTIDRWS